MSLGLALLIINPIVVCVALFWMLVVRRQSRRLARTIRQQLSADSVSPPAASALPGELGSAINELLDLTQRSVVDAARRVKELEIQVRVTASQHQDARDILHSISDAVLVTDPFDDLVMANEAAGRIFHFEPNQVTGQSIEQILSDRKLIELIREMRQSRTTGGCRIVELTSIIDDPDGRKTERSFKITLSCVGGESDGPSGVVAVLHDMTREREVAKMKNEFVSNVSHELRTPLASIKAYVEMLLDGEADDEKTKREFYEVIHNEANRLSRLIDNILSISRIESGLVQVNKQPQSLTVILKEAIEVITPQARCKQITIAEKLTPVFYQTIADKDMLYQAVLNLLSNAVKYTPQGGTVTIETLVDEADRKVVTRVSDSGVGIPAKDVPFVFDKFYRSDANNHMAKGTGLGLALVKHIVETVHKGHLTVASEVGKGSCFGFELQLAA